MAYHILVRPEVVDDLDEIESWYEKKQRGLGNQFHNEYETTLDRILIQPMNFVKVQKEIRRIEMKTYPYAVFYQVIGDSVVILRVLHERRHPQHWPKDSNGTH